MRRAQLGIFLFVWLFGWTQALVAQEDMPNAAREAAEQLKVASAMLAAAGQSQDRVKALTKTVTAYESGLSVMRNGLRAITLQQQQLHQQLDGQDVDISRLVGVLHSINTAPDAALIVHPGGAIDTARAGMMVTDVLSSVQSEVSDLRQRLVKLNQLEVVHDKATSILEKGLREVQTARTELARAAADRKNLPKRFVEDPLKTALLIAASETLDTFANGLSEIVVGEVSGSLPDITDRKGTLALPVKGRVIRKFNQADAAGIVRPGIVIATEPEAVVTVPTAATIRYRGPLLDFGLVSILEPQAGVLFVIAGLQSVFGETGEVLPAGSPIGLMGGNSRTLDKMLVETSAGPVTERSETLYLEVRQDKVPVDPLTWFRMQKD